MFPGAKSNLTDIAAQIGIDQLRRLDGFNVRRRALAERYFEEFDGFSGVSLPARGDAGHSWHMFQVLIDFRARGMTRPAFQTGASASACTIPAFPASNTIASRATTKRTRRSRRESGARRSRCRYSRRWAMRNVVRVCRELREVLN